MTLTAPPSEPEAPTPASPDAGRSLGRSVGDAVAGTSWLPSALLILSLVVAWQVLATGVFEGRGVFPPPLEVLAAIRDNADIYWRHSSTTLREAWPGFLWGNLIAIALGFVAVSVPFLEKPILQLAVAVTALPIIAIGPIFQITLSGDAPKSALAGMAVFFTTLIGTIVGLRATDTRSLDVIRALGGSSLTALRKVRIKAALPDLFSALRISAPAAILGAIVGEFLGGNDNGLGIALVSAQATAQTDKVWAAAFVATALAGLGYAVIAVVGRLLTPWAPRR